MNNRASIGSDFYLRPFCQQDHDWVAAMHVEHYGTVERFDQSFEAAVLSAPADIGKRLDHDRTFGLVLQDAEGACFGSLFVCDMGEAARLRLFLLDKGLQGRGMGRAMLIAAIDGTGLAGFQRIEVSTFDAHAAACTLYAQAGFVEQERFPCSAFGRNMVQVNFAYTLVRPNE